MDWSTFEKCIAIIGQYLAITEDGSSIALRYIEEYKILDDLQRVMIDGKLQSRRDTIWVMQNLATDEECCTKIMDSETHIYMNLLLEIRKARKSNDIKSECFLFFANLLQHISAAHLDKLLYHDIVGVLHDQLHSNVENEQCSNMLAIECLGFIFR